MTTLDHMAEMERERLEAAEQEAADWDGETR